MDGTVSAKIKIGGKKRKKSYLPIVKESFFLHRGHL